MDVSGTGAMSTPSRPSGILGYWKPKIEGNRTRDIAQTAALERAGWVVVRGWEHELPGQVADRVRLALALVTQPGDGREEAAISARRGSAPHLLESGRVSKDRPSRRSGVDVAERRGR